MSFFCKQSGIEKTCIVMEKHGFWVPRISRKMGLGASWYPKIKFQVPNPSQLSKDWIYLNQFIDLNFPAKWKGPMFSFHFSQKNMSWYPYYMNLPSNWFELFFSSISTCSGMMWLLNGTSLNQKMRNQLTKIPMHITSLLWLLSHLRVFQDFQTEQQKSQRFLKLMRRIVVV